ncbi:MAG TPA: TonB family protein [Casimicrobiaceae bacterium]|nr:TonB family protein [Casimicrobiaceae bacterium]
MVRSALPPRVQTPGVKAASSAKPAAQLRPGVRAVAQPKAAAPAAARKSNLSVAGALPPARIPPEALATPRRLSTIGIAIAISIALHAIALTLHFTIGASHDRDPNPPLEVALVNARSASKPTKANLLAQANLDGGGNTEQNRQAKTPLPLLPETPKRTVAVASSREQVPENATHEMMTQLRSPNSILTPEPKPLSDPEPTESATANDVMQKTLEAVRLEAKIARDMDEYQKIPRRKHIGAQAREYRFARYVEDWRLKVEHVGNVHYPEAARRKKLYGSLILTVFIRADGSVEKVEVNRKSGQRILDAAAVKIVQMAAPFAPFPDDIRRDTDILSITRTWTFARGDELRSE